MPTRGPTMPQHPTRFPSRFACGHLFSFFHFSRLLRSTSTCKSTSAPVVACKRRTSIYGESNDVSLIPEAYEYSAISRLHRKSRCDGCPRAIFPFDPCAYHLAAIRPDEKSKFVVRVPFFLFLAANGDYRWITRMFARVESCTNRQSRG